MCNNCLDYVDNCRDLGIKIENYSCKSDMEGQFFKFYANANMLMIVPMMSRCSYLNRTVLTCTVHNS